VIARRLVLALALTTLVPFLSACGGGGSQNASQPLPSTAPTLTVPGDAKTPTVDDSTNTGTTTTDTSTTTATTTAPPWAVLGFDGAAVVCVGAAAPQTGGATPDSPTNDQAPPANSPASKFEQFCQENPGAC
jgi:hypothetical protein